MQCKRTDGQTGTHTQTHTQREYLCTPTNIAGYLKCEYISYFSIHTYTYTMYVVCVVYREGHFDATKLLLDHGVECNMPSGSNDDTPLTLACWKGHSDIVSLLIEQGSNLNHQTKTGCTPLMEATRYCIDHYMCTVCMHIYVYVNVRT